MKDQVYPLGVDCTWLAVDSEGKIIAFVTGGEGPIPKSVVDIGEAYFDEVDAILERLPRKSGLLPRGPKTPPSYYANIAKRGFYIFDWSDVHKTKGKLHASYELLAAPEVPVFLCELSGNFKKKIERLLINKRVSIEDIYLDVEKYFVCLKGYG